jgi:hypothetical protein
MQNVVFIAEFFRGKPFLQSLCFCCSAVLVCTADEECVPVLRACTRSALVQAVDQCELTIVSKLTLEEETI